MDKKNQRTTIFLASIIPFIMAVCFASCASTVSSTRQDTGIFQFDFPEPERQLEKVTLWATYYHVWYAEVTSASGHALLDVKGDRLSGVLTARDWCMAGVEGTVQVKDTSGKIATYNYAGRGQDVQVECAQFFNKGTLINPVAIGKTRWTLALGPYGDGVAGIILIPFRTIAVDTIMFPIGSVIYVPDARGKEIQFPNGQTVKHDGYFFAGDVGGAIKHTHIDVFSGVQKTNPFPDFVKNGSSKTFEAYRVTDERIIATLKRQHVLSAK